MLAQPSSRCEAETFSQQPAVQLVAATVYTQSRWCLARAAWVDDKLAQNIICLATPNSSMRFPVLAPVRFSSEATAPTPENVNSYPAELLSSTPVQVLLFVMPSGEVEELCRVANLHWSDLLKARKLLLQQVLEKQQQVAKVSATAAAALAAAETAMDREGGLRYLEYGSGFVRVLEQAVKRAKTQIAAEATRVTDDGAAALQSKQEALEARIAAAAARAYTLTKTLQTVKERESFVAEQQVADAAAEEETAVSAATPDVAPAPELTKTEQAVAELATTPGHQGASSAQQAVAPHKRGRWLNLW
ncbi:hypothetical protein COO60DRAFT_452640 [Scenedesmus sp. NREL 46B-D3]|nr:hypothetical protein COO60DRAFT_452640 [Scenedesmus sp. NREL 46B-D3]